MTRAGATAALALSVLASAACFSERPDEPTGPGDDDEVVVTMTAQLTFEPATANARTGQTVVWRNTSGFVHTATGDPGLARDASNVSLPAGAGPWNSGSVGASGEFRMAFDVPGEYRYVCLPHEAQGMVGRVVVDD